MSKDTGVFERAQEREPLEIIRAMNRHWGKTCAKVIRDCNTKPTVPDDEHSNAD